MPFPLAGELCAVVAPLCWAIAVILFRRSSAAPAISMNLFKNVLAIGLLTITMGALGIHLPTDRPVVDWVRLAVSGIVGLAVADTLLFEGLRRIGAARLAIVDTTYAPMVVFLAWAVLGEQPKPLFVVGAVAVLIGVSIATLDLRGALVSSMRGPAAAGGADRELAIGVGYAFAAICGTACGVMLSKVVLARSDLVEVTFTRLAFGVAAQVVWITLRGGWREASVAFRPGPVWKTLVPGAIVGTYLSLVFWLGGFKWADASVAAVLNQLASVYILVLARVVLGETLSRRQVGGAGLAAAGAVWIVAVGR